MKGFKIVLGVLVVLLLVAVGLNYYYGEKYEQTFERYLQRSAMEADVNLEYENLSVNPVLRKVNVKGMELYDDTTRVIFEEADLILSWQDLRDFINDELTEVNDFQFTFRDITATDSLEPMKMYFDEVSFSYHGHLSNEMFDSDSMDLILEKAHDFELTISGFQPDFALMMETDPELAQVMEELQLTPDDFADYLDSGEIRINALYEPDNKKFDFVVESIENEYGNGEANFSFTLAKDFFGEYMPDDIKLLTDIEYEDNGLLEKLGLNLEKYDAHMELEVDYAPNTPEQYSVTNGVYQMNLVGLNVPIPDAEQEQLAVLNMFGQTPQFETLIVDSWRTDFRYQKERLVGTSQLGSPGLNADLELDIDLGSYPPYINKANLTFSNMAEDIESLFFLLEFMIGQELPRENGNIVIEAWGSVEAPQIKGINLY